MDRLERLVNLVAALIDTNHPLTRADIKQRIEGYSDEEDAFRRNFERDKELLRQMGFPLTTEALDPRHPDELGYRIPRELYELPDAGFDESELAALRLAAGAVQIEGEDGQEAVIQALRKLGGAVGEGSRPGSGGRISAGIAALPAGDSAAVAFAAVAQRQRVSFSYRGEAREVDPWRLSFHRGHWYLAGMDHHRGGERLFRLDRVDGPLAPFGPPRAFERPSGAQMAPPPPWRMGEDEEVTVTVMVDADQAQWAIHEVGENSVVRRVDDGSVELEVPVTSQDAFRSFVLGYLDHAEILGPPRVRQATVEWLQAIAGGAPIQRQQ